jgi:hypothetical protein
VGGGVRRDPVTILAKVERSLMPVVGARVECYIQVGSVVSIYKEVSDSELFK